MRVQARSKEWERLLLRPRKDGRFLAQWALVEWTGTWARGGEPGIETTVALSPLETFPAGVGKANLGGGTGDVLRNGKEVAEGVARKRGSGADM